MLATTFLGLSAGAFALWLCRRPSQKKKKGKQQRDGPSLAEEIEAALALEAQGLDDDELQELKAEFESATEWVAENGGSIPQEALLPLYGCYKQALVGECPPDRPRGIEASYKWEAWHRLAGTSRAEAMRSYVAALKKAVPKWSPDSRGEVAPEGGSAGTLGSTFGNSVSTMTQSVGDTDDVDETPVGKLNELIHNSDVSAALQVLRRSPDLAFKADKDGMTPMHWAADSGSCEVLNALLALLGSDASLAKQRVNMLDADGSTPLDFAVITENEDIARLLAKAGADPAVGNEELPEDWKPMFSES